MEMDTFPWAELPRNVDHDLPQRGVLTGIGVSTIVDPTVSSIEREPFSSWVDSGAKLIDN